MIVKTKKDRYGGIIRIKRIRERTLAEIATAPGYTRVQAVINNVHIPIAPATRGRSVTRQERTHATPSRHVTQSLPSIAEFDRQLARLHVTNTGNTTHTQSRNDSQSRPQQTM